MSRLDIKTASKAQTVVDRLYKDMERRIASSPPGLCPIDMSLTFLQLCHAQSCGKCVPCRIGLGQLSILMGQVLDGTGTMLTIDTIEKTARAIVASADCAIGRDAARLVLDGLVPRLASEPRALRVALSCGRGRAGLCCAGARGAVRRRRAPDSQG